jgi:hypothetical protein
MNIHPHWGRVFVLLGGVGTVFPSWVIAATNADKVARLLIWVSFASMMAKY